MTAKNGMFFIGRKFKSFKELEGAINKYSKSTYCAFWKRDSRKIGGVSVPKSLKSIEPRLVYYEIKYTCIFGGRKLRGGQLPSQCDISNLRNNCPVKIYLRATTNGKSLEVRGLVTEHNHECSKELYPTLPVPRRMLAGSGLAVRGSRNLSTSDVSAITASPVSMAPKPNKSAVQSGKNMVKSKAKSSGAKGKKMSAKQPKLSDDADKKLGTLLDLWSTDGTPNVTLHRDEVLAIAQQLIQKYDCQAEVLFDETTGDFLGIYLQTPSMKRTAEAFPEFVAMDGTFSLLRTGVIPAYFCQVENGNCFSELVAVCLVIRADRATFEWFLRVLDAGNPQLSSRARYVLADRSLIQLDVLQQRFVGVPLVPAVFHAPSTFARQVASGDMGLSKNQRIVCAEYFQKMVASDSEAEFDEQYEHFRDIAPRAALSHYSSHWHPSRWEWSSARDAVRGHFLANVNAGLETLNLLLEAGTNRNTTLTDLLDRLLSVLARLESERDTVKVAPKSQKGAAAPVPGHPPGSDEELFTQLLNRHPARMVLKQMECAAQVTVPATADGHDCYRIATPEGSVATTVRSCTCPFVEATLLPCRHIFAVRRERQAPGYEAGLCHQRWTKQYYENYVSGTTAQQVQQPVLPPAPPPVQPSIRLSVQKSEADDESSFELSKLDTSEEMMQEVLEVIESLADLTSRKNVETIREHLNLLKVLRRSWASGRQVSLLVDSETLVPAAPAITAKVEPTPASGLVNGVNGHSSVGDEREMSAEVAELEKELPAEPKSAKRKGGKVKAEREPPAKKKPAKAR